MKVGFCLRWAASLTTDIRENASAMAITHRRLKLLTFPKENVSDSRGLRIYADIAHVKNAFYAAGFLAYVFQPA